MFQDLRFRIQAFTYPTFLSVWETVPCRGFRIQVSRFRFQVGNYLTFLSAWKAVLSEAMVAWDEVSGKYCMDSGY